MTDPSNNKTKQSNKVFDSTKKIEERESRTRLVNNKNQGSETPNLDSAIGEWRESEIRIYRKDPLKDTFLPAKVVFLIHPRGKYKDSSYLKEILDIRQFLSSFMRDEKGEIIKDEDGRTIRNYECNKNKAYARMADLFVNFIEFMTFPSKTDPRRDELMFYNNEKGILQEGGQSIVRAWVQAIDDSLTTHAAREVLEKVKCKTMKNRKLLNNKNVRVLKNGVLDLETFKILPFSPDYYCTAAIPTAYNPKQDCPEIWKYLHLILSPEKVQLLFEAIGFCLLTDYRFERAILFYGKTHTGKTTTSKLIKAFFGKENTSNLTLQQISDKQFLVKKLEGKIANISPDLPGRDIIETGMFKAITGKDTITADRKHQEAIDIENPPKLFFQANYIPATKYDDSDAYYIRWIIIDFLYQHLDSVDSTILDRLTTPEELSGLLNHAIAGLKRLLKRGGFEEKIDTEAAEESYKSRSDPIKYFMGKEAVTEGTDLWVVKAVIYERFIQLCKRLDRDPIGLGSFTKEIIKWAPRRKAVDKQIDGERVKIYKGIGLRGNQDETKGSCHEESHRPHRDHRHFPSIMQTISKTHDLLSFTMKEVDKNPVTSVTTVPSDHVGDFETLPVTREYWKENILKIIEIAGKDKIIRKEILKKATKVLRLGVGHHNQINIYINELLQEELIFEPKKDFFQLTQKNITPKTLNQSEEEQLYDKINDLIELMLDKTDDEPVEIKKILDRAVKKGLSKEKVVKYIDECTRSGVYFEPQQGYIKKA